MNSMPQFEYIAIDLSGRQRHGRLAAAEFSAAYARLAALGWRVEMIRPLEADDSSELPWLNEGLNEQYDVESVVAAPVVVAEAQPTAIADGFTSDWQQISRDGRWLGPVVRHVALQFVPRQRRSAWLVLADQLAAATPHVEKTAEPMARMLSPMLTAAVQSRSESRLLKDLLAMAQQLHERRSTRLQRLAYPAIVVLSAIVMFVGFSFLLAPEYEQMFRAFQLEMPPLTRVILGTAQVVRHYGYWLVGALLANLLLAKWLFRSGSDWWHLPIWNVLPLVGKTRLFRGYAHVAQSLASLLEIGVPAPQALRMVAASAALSPVREALIGNADQLEHVSLPPSDGDRPQLPEILQFALQESNGPVAGRVDILRSSARHYEQRVQRRDLFIGGICEVAAIVAAALLVGVIVSGVYSPLLGLITNLSQ